MSTVPSTAERPLEPNCSGEVETMCWYLTWYEIESYVTREHEDAEDDHRQTHKPPVIYGRDWSDGNYGQAGTLSATSTILPSVKGLTMARSALTPSKSCCSSLFMMKLFALCSAGGCKPFCEFVR